MSERVPGKGRARDLPFRGTIVYAARRRCRLTALERAARDWCDRQGVVGHPSPLVPPDPAIVAAWLKRLKVRVVADTVELYQVGMGSSKVNNRRLEWRVEFDIQRDHDVYLNARSVGWILGMRGAACHKTVVRLVAAGFLAGFEADKEAEYVYGHRAATWGKSRAGRRWRVHPDDLARFLLEHPEQYDPRAVRGKPWKALAAEGHRKRRWHRVPEIAARLGCSEQNVRDMLRLGDMQGVHMRDRQAITWYVKPEWVEDTRNFLADYGGFRTACGRVGLARKYPERVARRARLLAARPELQAHYDADATRLLCEVRDVAGRRRKAAEAAALAAEYERDEMLFPPPPPTPPRPDPRWRAAAEFLAKYGGDDGWDEWEKSA